jgi:signal peptidase I
VSKNAVLRYGFYSFWFGLIPGALALLVVVWLSSKDPDQASALVRLKEIVADQPVPAIIVFFTLFEMLIYSVRDKLPLADRVGYAGPSTLPRELRTEYEQAQQLTADARRLMRKHRRAIEKELGSSAKTELDRVVTDLERTLASEPFDPERFRETYDAASRSVVRHLQRWQKSDVREYAESILIAVAVALLLRAFVVEAFKIPSGSMLPTLQLQDHIFVNKLSYGPPIPMTKRRLWNGLPPKRGDVMVFEYPNPDPVPRQDYIKRVIALPGDTLEVHGGHPIINGWPVPSCSAGQYDFEEGPGVLKHGELFVEFLGDYSYLTVYEDNHLIEQEQGPYHVAPGEVWVMGDNRNNSSDSRAWNHGLGGGAPFENIKGRALFVWLSFGSDGWPSPHRILARVMGPPKLPAGTSPTVVANVERCLTQRPAVTNPPPPKSLNAN